jgi:hypothetical protein
LAAFAVGDVSSWHFSEAALGLFDFRLRLKSGLNKTPGTETYFFKRKPAFMFDGTPSWL